MELGFIPTVSSFPAGTRWVETFSSVNSARFTDGAPQRKEKGRSFLGKADPDTSKFLATRGSVKFEPLHSLRKLGISQAAHAAYDGISGGRDVPQTIQVPRAPQPWATESALELTADNMEHLLANEIPCVIYENLLTADECKLAVDLLRSNEVEYYDRFARVGMVGRAQVETKDKDPANYFAGIEQADRYRRALREHGIDPVTRVINLLRRTMGSSVRSIDVAAEPDGRFYHAGNLHQVTPSGVELHFDWAKVDADARWTIFDCEKQMAWNVFLTTCVGGEFLVYNCPADASMMFGDRSQADGKPSCVIPEVPGAVVIINSQNLHEFLPVTDGTLLTMTSFIGVTPDNRWMLWV